MLSTRVSLSYAFDCISLSPLSKSILVFLLIDLTTFYDPALFSCIFEIAHI